MRFVRLLVAGENSFEKRGDVSSSNQSQDSAGTRICAEMQSSKNCKEFSDFFHWQPASMGISDGYGVLPGSKK